MTYRSTFRCPACWQEEVRVSLGLLAEAPYHIHYGGEIHQMQLIGIEDTQPLADYLTGINGELKKLADTPPMFIFTHPKETTMSQPHTYLIPAEFRQFLDQIQHHIATTAAQRSKTPEQRFRELDVQPGDRVRLTGGDSTLEGEVLGVKVKDRESQVRIKGFDHTGGKAGGQHVWFAVKNYKIEVLKKAYRWTDRDRVIAEIADRKDWATTRREDQREADRRVYGARADRIRKILGADGVE